MKLKPLLTVNQFHTSLPLIFITDFILAKIGVLLLYYSFAVVFFDMTTNVFVNVTKGGRASLKKFELSVTHFICFSLHLTGGGMIF